MGMFHDDIGPHEEPPTRTPPVNPTVVIFLSIYLLLLAFFVVLNAISNEDRTRVEAALGSVNATFRPIRQPRSELIDILSDSTEVEGNADFLEEVYRAFESLIDVPGLAATRDGNTIEVILPESFLFAPLSPSLRPERAALFEQLAELLKTSVAGRRNEVRFAVGVGSELPNPEHLSQNLAVMRAAALAEAFTGREVPTDSIMVGLAVGDAGNIRLSFLARRISDLEAPADGAGL